MKKDRKKSRSRGKNKRRKERSESSSFYTDSEESIESSSISSSSSNFKKSRRKKNSRSKKSPLRDKNKKKYLKEKIIKQGDSNKEKKLKSIQEKSEFTNINENDLTPKIDRGETSDHILNINEDEKLNEEVKKNENEKQEGIEKINEEEKPFQGIELRSRLMRVDDDSNTQALEIYTNFKRLISTEIPNVFRKLMIFNIPPNANEDEIKQYFLTLLTTLNPNMKLITPIIGIEQRKSEHGIFYIFELATKDDIEILKAMNGTEWRGYRIRIEKPAVFCREFNSTQGKYIELKELRTNQSFLIESDNKLYMGNIPTSAKEHEIREIVESFGQLKTFNLVKDTNSEDDINRGFCFFEYVDEKVTERAIKGLHNREMGEKRLKVQRANINSKSFSIAKQLKETPVDMTPREPGKSNFSDGSLANQALLQIDVPLYASMPSRVILLINMITPEDIMDDIDYREISEDIRMECMQFGTVLNVEIPRPDKNTWISGPSVGKIFVKFSTIPSSKKARYNLSGRKFNRRTVIASFYPENYFDVREFNYQG